MTKLYCRNSWPDKSSLPDATKPYWKYEGEFSVHNNLLLFQNRVVIPKQQQQEILQKIHNGHQGIQHCHLRAQLSVWWLHIRHAIDNFIQHCPECQQTSIPPCETLMTATLPSHPGEKTCSTLRTPLP